MAIGLGVLVIVIAIAVALWLSRSALIQVKQLRGELDETQRQLNDLKTAVEANVTAPPPPVLPKSRPKTNLEDLREQLRASHRDEASSEDEQ